MAGRDAGLSFDQAWMKDGSEWAKTTSHPR